MATATPATDARESARPEDMQTKPAGTAILVLGIAALVLSAVPFLGMLLTLLTLVFGVIVMTRGQRSKKLVAGLVLAAIGLTIAIASSGGNESDADPGSATSEAVVTAPSTEAEAPVPSDEPVPTEPAEPAEALEPETSKPSPSTEPQDAARAAYGKYTGTEKKFVGIVESAMSTYEGAETDLQRSEAVRGRDAAVCAEIGPQVKDWVGVVHDIGANGEGKAYIDIEIAPNIRVQTWNNALSDAFDKTLIDTSDPMFSRLVEMTEGQKVVFSGEFVGVDGSCLQAANITEVFGAIDPQFIVRFSDVRLQK